MSKVITFSRTFPAYHPKAGHPTWFVEKIWKSMYDTTSFNGYSEIESEYQKYFPVKGLIEENIHNHAPKHHTIRAGSRWKVGDKFSPRVWSGKPYNSKQIIIAPDVEIARTWDFKLHGGHCFTSFKDYLNDDDLKIIAQNDGLSLDDMVSWFKNFSKPFDGQIICWNKDIQY